MREAQLTDGRGSRWRFEGPESGPVIVTLDGVRVGQVFTWLGADLLIAAMAVGLPAPATVHLVHVEPPPYRPGEPDGDLTTWRGPFE